MKENLLNMCSIASFLKLAFASLIFILIMTAAYWLYTDQISHKEVPKQDYIKAGISSFCAYFTIMFLAKVILG